MRTKSAIKSLLFFFLFSFLLFLFPKNTFAQLYCRASGNDCIIDLSFNPNPDCGPNERDPCSSGDYTLCCQLAGEWDVGGTLITCNNIACDPVATPTPMPGPCVPPNECLDACGIRPIVTGTCGARLVCCGPPGGLTPTPTISPVNCDTTCINAPQPDCDLINGDFKGFNQCLDDSGTWGSCCEAPPQTTNVCTLNGGICRTPAYQSNPGSCNWNEIELGDPDDCFPTTMYPPGTLCCDPVSVAICGSGSLNDGYCDTADACTSRASGITNCEQFGQVCCLPSPAGASAPIEIFCDQDGNPTTEPDTGQIWTAIGCIPIVDNGVDPILGNLLLTEFSSFWLRIGMGVGAGIAALIIAVAGVIIKTSEGNPQRLSAARELLFGAVAALILIIFSAFLLRVVGVDLLGIPQLG